MILQVTAAQNRVSVTLEDIDGCTAVITFFDEQIPADGTFGKYLISIFGTTE